VHDGTLAHFRPGHAARVFSWFMCQPRSTCHQQQQQQQLAIFGPPIRRATEHRDTHAGAAAWWVTREVSMRIARRHRLLRVVALNRLDTAFIQSMSSGPRRRLCSDPYKVLGVPHGADQADIRRRYLELAKSTHPDVEQGDADMFRRISSAYETLTKPSSAEDPFPESRPPSAGAQAYRREQAGMAKVMMAMHLASEGQRADSLDLLLSVIRAGAGQGLPGQGQKAVLLIFDACAAFSPSPFQRIEYAKLQEVWQWLLEFDAVDAQACEAWKWSCIRSLRPADALAAQRLAERRQDDAGFARNVWRDFPP
jgi:hypothetical protein